MTESIRKVGSCGINCPKIIATEKDYTAKNAETNKLSGASAGTGTEDGTGTVAAIGMGFELDAVLSPVIKTPYSAFGHTHHITGKAYK